jgi:hypothetical protein
MKKLLIPLIALLSFSVLTSQEISVNELINMNSMSFKEFDTFLVEKGYAWSVKKNRGQKNIAIYSWQETSKGLSSRWVIKDEHGLLQKTVEFHTNREEEYNAIKRRAENNGFKRSSAERLPGGGLSEIFSNDEVTLIFRIIPGQRSSFYEIEVQSFK